MIPPGVPGAAAPELQKIISSISLIPPIPVCPVRGLSPLSHRMVNFYVDEKDISTFAAQLVSLGWTMITHNGVPL